MPLQATKNNKLLRISQKSKRLAVIVEKILVITGDHLSGIFLTPLTISLSPKFESHENKMDVSELIIK